MSNELLLHLSDVEMGALVMCSLCCAASYCFINYRESSLRTDRVLRGLMLAFTLFLSIGYAFHAIEWYPDIACRPVVSQLLMQLEVLIIPLIALILTNLTQRKAITYKLALLHFIPFVSMIILSTLIVSKWFNYIFITYTGIYIAIMLNFTLISCSRYEKFLKNQYSELFGRVLSWTYSVVCIFIIILCLWGVKVFVHSAIYQLVYQLICLVAWPIICFNIHKVLQVREYSKADTSNLDVQIAEENISEAEKERLIEQSRKALSNSNQQAASRDESPEEIFEKRLVSICEEGKLFTTEDLTREELARKLMVNHTYLTKMLKETRGKSFYEYINGLRMQYAVELLKDPTFPLDAIPLEIGYKHKSTYYRVFSEHYSCSPLEYRNRYMKEKQLLESGKTKN